MKPTLPLPVLPQPGDFGLVPCTGRNFIDKAAMAFERWGTDSKYGHAFVYMGNNQIVEAEPGGARKVDLHYDPATIFWSTGRINLDVRDRLEITELADGFAERRTPYGWADIFAIAIAQRRAGHLIDPTASIDDQPWWVRRIQSLDTVICSQLVDLCYQGAGIQLFDDHRIAGLVSPGDLWRLLLTMPLLDPPSPLTAA